MIARSSWGMEISDFLILKDIFISSDKNDIIFYVVIF